MKSTNYYLKPQDVVILLKIISLENELWMQKPLAKSLHMSQSEVSQALVRLKNAGLLDGSGKKVMRLAFFDFLKYGLSIVFAQKPGALVRGIPTAHSAPPLNKMIKSEEIYVWPDSAGTVRGQAIFPLYPSILYVVEKDEKLYQLLALCDALRVGRAREKEFALQELKKRILDGE